MVESDAAANAIWKEIEASESYLVCSMYQEAAQLASSILERLPHAHAHAHHDTADMLESTAMVLLQAFNQLATTPDILNQLRLHFLSLKAIPPRVLLTGVSFQLAQGSALSVQQFLEEFLHGWTLQDAQYSTLITDTNPETAIILGIHEYLQVVELYAVTVLATLQKNVHLAISWVQNASLPHQNRQGLLRRLHSMHSPKSTILSQSCFLQSSTNSNEAYPLKEQNVDNEKNRSKESVTKLSERIEACFWCFRGINLKIGTRKFVITSGKIMLGCLILLIYYVFRKKKATLKRIVRIQATAVKRALVDLWQLAFSYQVNPLAAVQPLSAATRQAASS